MRAGGIPRSNQDLPPRLSRSRLHGLARPRAPASALHLPSRERRECSRGPLAETHFSFSFFVFRLITSLIRAGRHQKRRGGIKAPRPRRCTDPLCVQVCVSLQARASTVAATRFASSAGSLCQLSVCASSCFSCENTRLNATHIPFCLAGRRHAIAGCGSPRHGHHACTLKWWPPLRLRCCASAASVRNRSLTGHTVLGGAGSRRTGGCHAIRQSVQARASCRRQRISSSKSCPNTFTSLKRQSPRSASTWRAPCALCLRVQSTLRGTPRDSAEDLQRALLLAREFGRTTPDGLLGACTMSF